MSGRMNRGKTHKLTSKGANRYPLCQTCPHRQPVTRCRAAVHASIAFRRGVFVAVQAGTPSFCGFQGELNLVRLFVAAAFSTAVSATGHTRLTLVLLPIPRSPANPGPYPRLSTTGLEPLRPWHHSL